MVELGGPQISALLESVPGIVNVLRSPVANAMVAMIRAGARTGEFRQEDALELVQYAVRRGLIGNDEGERLLAETEAALGKRLGRAKAKKKPAAKAGRPAAKKKAKPVKRKH